MVGVRGVELGLARNQQGTQKEWMHPWMGFVSMASSFMDLVSCTVVENAQQHELENDASPSQQGEAFELVSNFCSNYFGTKIEPTTQELDGLWVLCMQIPSSAVVAAFHDQLTWGNGEFDWQPKFRAVCAIEHFRRAGGTATVIATTVISEAEELLRYLVTDVPQCSARVRCMLAEHGCSSQERVKRPRADHPASGISETAACVLGSVSRLPASQGVARAPQLRADQDYKERCASRKIGNVSRSRQMCRADAKVGRQLRESDVQPKAIAAIANKLLVKQEQSQDAIIHKGNDEALHSVRQVLKSAQTPEISTDQAAGLVQDASTVTSTAAHATSTAADVTTPVHGVSVTEDNNHRGYTPSTSAPSSPLMDFAPESPRADSVSSHGGGGAVSSTSTPEVRVEACPDTHGHHSPADDVTAAVPIPSVELAPCSDLLPETETDRVTYRRPTSEQLRYLPLSAVDSAVEVPVDPFAFVNAHLRRV